MPKTVAIVKWSCNDEVTDALQEQIAALNYTPVTFLFDQAIPSDAAFVFSFAPYNRLLQIPRQLAHFKSNRPVFIHWSTENPPDIRLPWVVNRTLAMARSRSESLFDFSPALHSRMIRYRIMGDYLFAQAQKWLDVFVESSLVFADWYKAHGVPAFFAPWGSVKNWYADLKLERDIDVLWMGQRRTRRRSEILETVRANLAQAGYRMLIADGEENPFLYGAERTRTLNRSKITLSLRAQAPHDNIFHYRFRLAAPNRSLLLTEHELAHCHLYRPANILSRLLLKPSPRPCFIICSTKRNAARWSRMRISWQRAK